MKILFISPDIEEKGRGITGILKAMVGAAKSSGHEVGLLVGYPNVDSGQSDTLDTKVEHIHLQHYMLSGKSSFNNHFKGGIKRRRNLAKIMMSASYLGYKGFNVRQDYLNSDDGITKNLDFIIKIPFCYQFINHGLESVTKKIIKRAIKKYNVDLVIIGAPMNITKREVKPAKLAQFVHDVMPIELVETPPDNGTPQRFAKQMYAASCKSDLVFTNSIDTKNKVLEVNPNANVKVLYGIASNKSESMPKTQVLNQFNIAKNKYLLFISAIEKRKNVKNLFEAYAKVYDTVKIPLVIVGSKGYGYEDIINYRDNLPVQIKENIIMTGFISEADKYMLLNNARAFVFPSVYEGIGLPIIEAFFSNLPVLTSRRGAIPEAGGKAALYIDNPYDVDEISRGIVEISNNTDLRKKLIKNIPSQTEKFSVDNFNKRFKDGIKTISK